MRIVLIALLGIHAALHLLGCFRSWGWAELPQLSGKLLFPLPLAVVGAGWALAALLLFAAALAFGFRADMWRALACAGVVLSQLMIVLQWQDAKAGTLANVLIALALWLSFAALRFERRVDAAVEELLASGGTSDGAGPVPAEALQALPPSVRAWLTRAGVVGKPAAARGRLRQRGELRTAPNAAFMQAEAVQYFNLVEPGFVWFVHTSLKGVPIAGADRFFRSKGRMEILAASAVHMVDAAGPKIDQGAALRFLGELVWFPSAALRPYVHWEAVDQHRARAHFRAGEQSCSALFEFDAQHRFVALSAERYLGDGALTPWRVTATEWRNVRGLELPTRGSVSWKLPDGDFDYYRWTIDDVEQNAAIR